LVTVYQGGFKYRGQKLEIFEFLPRRKKEMKSNQMKVRMSDEMFERFEECRQDWVNEFGLEISRAAFLRSVFLQWDKMAGDVGGKIVENFGKKTLVEFHK